IQIPYPQLKGWSPDPDKSPYAKIDVRDATKSEIDRMIGDWERMQAYSVRESDPGLSALYLRQAGKTLHRRYDAGDRDPRLLAILGLYSVDANLPDEGRGFLEAAVAAEVTRPEAYIQLAKLRFLVALEGKPSSHGNLTADQLARVLNLLFVARKRWGLASDGYNLIADAWTASAVRPIPGNLEVLKEGLVLYPFDAALRINAAKCYKFWGYDAEANTLVEAGAGIQNFEALKPATILQATEYKPTNLGPSSESKN
ncbi:MAG TPA: hypothetical protein VFE25_00430, partial [Opitutaceae bacterium]|nr:hypothetical protein [Opitutaceae bacterium]